jgi:hypothetical protein
MQTLVHDPVQLFRRFFAAKVVMSHKKTDGDEQRTALVIQADSPETQKIEDVGNNSTLGTFILTLKSYIGSGILGLPFAFLQGTFVW